MKLYRVESGSFQRHELSLCIEGFFKGLALTYDGKRIDLKKGKCSLKDDNFSDRQIKVKFGFANYPTVQIDNDIYYPMGKLKWFEQILVVLPFGLLVLGGAIGGGLGAFAAYSNCLLMIEYKNSNLRYVLVTVVSALAYLCWFMAAILIQTMLKK